jgi:ABC-2 type transport system permease protein
MNKINLIIGREYWTRVKSKTFLLTTFLAPIGIVVVYAILGFLMTRGSDKQKNIAIIDNAGITKNIALNKNNLNFTVETKSFEALIEDYKKNELDGILVLPPLDSSMQKYAMIYHSDKTLALDESSSIESLFRKEIRNFKVKAFGIDQGSLDMIDTDLEIEPQTITNKDKEISSLTSIVSSVLGGAVGFLLFMVILVFGSQVMRGVNEEKINRIIEVIISSVKPFELMLGKVLGIGLVGLTQFAIWAILIAVFSLGASAFFGLDVSGMQDITNNEAARQVINDEGVQQKIMTIMRELMGMNWALIIPLYIFYFIIGYLIYASLFAAVGAAAGDDINEAQALTTIVMLPLMAAMYIGFAAVQAPDSSLAIWASIIPLTAPVVMPIRLPSDPALWQIGLSVVLSILFVFFMIWLASRIYRVGILMYGKKASFKELGKWIFYKG